MSADNAFGSEIAPAFECLVVAKLAKILSLCSIGPTKAADIQKKKKPVTTENFLQYKNIQSPYVRVNKKKDFILCNLKEFCFVFNV